MKKKRSIVRYIVLLMAWGLFAVVAFGPAAGVCKVREADLAQAKALSNAFAEIAASAMPAVVSIKVEKIVDTSRTDGGLNDPRGLFGDEFLRKFFGDRLPQPPQQQVQMGQGSGFIISPDGYILTNNHVVGDAEKITVTLQDGSEFPKAVLVGADPESEVALIKIDATGLPVLPLGDSAKSRTGDWVIAVGNPFGLAQTLTVGVISAVGRSNVHITEYEDFIQTDAAINPGNSGGPLINLDGQAIGINTAIYSQNGGYMGIGFAIPMNMVKVIQKQLKEKGRVVRGYLGVVIQDLTPELAKAMGAKESAGALIASLAPDSPAAKGGLRLGDIVVAIDQNRVTDTTAFRNYVATLSPGTKTAVTVIREGRAQGLTLSVGERPGPQAVAEAATSREAALGVEVQAVTAHIAQQLGVREGQGVVITAVQPGGPAETAGLQIGDIVLQARKKPVNTTGQFTQAVEEGQQSGGILLLVMRGEVTSFIVVPLK